MDLKIRARWLTKFAAYCGVSACRLLFATCRKQFIGRVLEEGMKSSHDQDTADRYVLLVWHDALLLPTFAAPKSIRQQCCCLVSKHQDGGYLADAMSWMDYTTVRGSSKRGGAEALRQLISETAGRHIIITPDGPRGPRRQMKLGAVFLASQMGRGILPSAYVVKQGWRVRGSWTDLVIPMPFTTIYLIVGEPIAIPANVPREELERYVEIAQQAMDRVNDEADKKFANQPGSEFIPRKKAA